MSTVTVGCTKDVLNLKGPSLLKPYGVDNYEVLTCSGYLHLSCSCRPPVHTLFVAGKEGVREPCRSPTLRSVKAGGDSWYDWSRSDTFVRSVNAYNHEIGSLFEGTFRGYINSRPRPLLSPHPGRGSGRRDAHHRYHPPMEKQLSLAFHVPEQSVLLDGPAESSPDPWVEFTPYDMKRLVISVPRGHPLSVSVRSLTVGPAKSLRRQERGDSVPLRGPYEGYLCPTCPSPVAVTSLGLRRDCHLLGPPDPGPGKGHPLRHPGPL